MSFNLDPELKKTDDMLDVWARDSRPTNGGGGMHPIEVMRLLHEGQVLGPEKLSTDAVMILVDQAYLRSPPKVKATIDVWYKSSAPVVVKAQRLGVSRAAVYGIWREALSYMRGSFRAKGLDV